MLKERNPRERERVDSKNLVPCRSRDRRDWSVPLFKTHTRRKQSHKVSKRKFWQLKRTASELGKRKNHVFWRYSPNWAVARGGARQLRTMVVHSVQKDDMFRERRPSIHIEEDMRSLILQDPIRETLLAQVHCIDQIVIHISVMLCLLLADGTMIGVRNSK